MNNCFKVMLLGATALAFGLAPACAGQFDADTGFGSGGDGLFGTDTMIIKTTRLLDSVDLLSGKQRILIGGQCSGSDTDLCISVIAADGNSVPQYSARVKLPDATTAEFVDVVAVKSGYVIVANVKTTPDSNNEIRLIKLKEDNSVVTDFGDQCLPGTVNFCYRSLLLDTSDFVAQVANSNVFDMILIGGHTKLRFGDTTNQLFVARASATGLLDPTFYGSGRRFFRLNAIGPSGEPIASDVDMDELRITDTIGMAFIAHTVSPTGNNVAFFDRLLLNGGDDFSFLSGAKTISFTDDSSGSAVIASVQRAAFDISLDDQIMIVADLNVGLEKKLGAYLLNSDGSNNTGFDVDGQKVWQHASESLTDVRVKALFDPKPVAPATVNFVVTGNNGMSSEMFLLASDGSDDGSTHPLNIGSINELNVRNSGRWLITGMLSGHPALLQVYGDKRFPQSIASLFASRQDVGTDVAVAVGPIAISFDADALTSLVKIDNGVGAAVAAPITDQSCVSTADHAVIFSSLFRINKGDGFCLLQTSSLLNSTSTVTTITVGDQRATFTSTTKAASSGGNGGGGGGAFGPGFLLLLVLFGRRKVQR